MNNFFRQYKAFLYSQDGEYEDEHFNRFIKTQIVEKLLQDLPTHNEGNGQWCDTGEDMDWACRSECMDDCITRIKAKWLGKETDATH